MYVDAGYVYDYERILGTTSVRRSLSENNTSDFWSISSTDDDLGVHRDQCVWTLQGADHCAHLLIPFGFGVTLMWICVLWIVVRVLRRRRSAVIADASASSSLCVCRSRGRRDVLTWTASACQTGEVIIVTTRQCGCRNKFTLITLCVSK